LEDLKAESVCKKRIKCMWNEEYHEYVAAKRV